MRNEVLERLRSATDAELRAMAHHVDVELEADHGVTLVRLSDAYEYMGYDDYITALASVGAHVASEAKWKRMPDVDDEVEVEWLEEYIFQAFAFIHRSDRASLSRSERARCRDRAEQALTGEIASAKEESDRHLTLATAAVGVGIGLVFWELALAGAAVVAAAKLFKNLFEGSNMKKLAPATLVLIHIRKRLEYEEVLRSATETEQS